MLNRRKFLSLILTIGLAPLLDGRSYLSSSSETFLLDFREIINRKGPIFGVGFVTRNCVASERLKAYCRSGKNFFTENRTCWIELDSCLLIRDLDGVLRTPREIAQCWGVSKTPAMVVVFRGHHPVAVRVGIGANIKALQRNNRELSCKEIFL